MPKLGSYQTVQELHRTAVGAVYAARRAEGGPGAFAVKVCRPDPLILGAEEAAGVVRRFLASARDQQSAAMPGLAPIHEIGELAADEDGPAGAYYATDLAARGSCERLISGAASVNARSLSNIVSQVARTLAELKRTRGRSHGNLDPRNVLLMDDVGLASVRVALADVLPETGGLGGAGGAEERTRGPRAEAADLRAVGELIYRLVMRRGYAGGWPVVDGPEWQGLAGRAGGKGGRAAGNAWRDLCNRLLDRSLETSESPDLTIEQLPGLIPEPGVGGPSRRKKALLSAAAAAVLIGGVVGWQLLRHHEPPPTFALIAADPSAGPKALERWKTLVAYYSPRRGWVDQLVQAVAPDRKIRESETAGLEALKRKCADVLDRARPLAAPENKPPQIAGRADEAGVFWEEPRAGNLEELGDLLRQPGRRSLEKYRYLGDAAIARTDAVLAEIDKLKEFLEHDWPPSRTVGSGADRFAAEGWAEAAAYLKAQADALKTELDRPATEGGPSESEAPEVGSLVVRMADLASAVEDIQSRADALRAVKVDGAGGDPVLAKFAGAVPALVRARAGDAKGADSIKALAAGVTAVRSLADDLRGYTRADRRPALDHREMARLVNSKGLAAAAPSEATFREWLSLAGGALVAGEHPAVKLRADAEQTGRLVEAYGAAPSNRPEERASFSREFAEIGAAIERAASQSYVVRTKPEVDREGREIAQRLATLTDSVRKETAAAAERERAALATIREELRSGAEWADITPSSAVNAEWKRRRDEMAARAGVTAASLDAERRRARDLLRRLDSQVRAAPAASPADGRWGELLAAAGAEARDKAIAASLGKIAPGTLTEEAVATAASEADGACRAWLDRAAALKADMSALNTLLTTRFSLDVAAEPGGPTGEALWTKWKHDAFTREPSVSAALAPLAARVEAHRAVAGETSPDNLIATIGRVSASDFDVGVAAWERLVRSDAPAGSVWPRTVEDLRRAADLSDRTRELVAQGQTDPAAREATVGRLGSAARACWVGFAKRLIGPGGANEGDVKARAQSLREAVAIKDRFGVQPESIADASVRADVLLVEFAAESADATDDAVRQATTRFRERIEAIPGIEQADPRVGTLVADLRRRIETPPKVTPVEELGPGAKGYAPRGRFENGRITFTIADGQDVTFVAVDRPEGTVFLAEEEASLDLFRAAVERAGLGSAEVINNGWLGDRPERPEKPDEEWTGARAWKWTRAAGGGYRLSAGSAWYDTRGNSAVKFQANPAYPDVTPDPQKGVDTRVVKLPPGMGEEPSGAMPMQRVTARGAAGVCDIIGCRLPTESEWRAGLAMMGPHEPSAVFNLRDQTFKREEDYIRPLRDGGTVSLDFHRLPDEGSYDYVADKVGGTYPFNDGCLWFWTVTTGPSDRRLRNMVGNVAEMVTTDGGRAYAAIGGSALSRIEDPIDRAVPIDETASYWDLGFRPAFSSKDRVPDPLRVQVRQVLTERLGETMLLMKP